MKLDPIMKPFILEDNVVIDHNKVNFINHVYHSLESVNMTTKFDDKDNKELVSNIHDIFLRPSFQTKIQYLDKNENNVHEGFVLPIGNIITDLFVSRKPGTFKLLGSLYEYVINQLSWEITVTRKIKKKRKRTSVDDIANPIGEITVKCKRCSSKYFAPYSLYSKDDIDDEKIQNLRSQTLACLEYFSTTILISAIEHKPPHMCVARLMLQP